MSVTVESESTHHEIKEIKYCTSQKIKGQETTKYEQISKALV